MIGNFPKSFSLGSPQVADIFDGKEVHKEGGGNTSRGNWEEFKKSYRTTARWNKAVQYLYENGELKQTPQDIGPLIKRVKEDIEQEEKEAILNFLWKIFGQDLLRGSVYGLPEWYKELLLKEGYKEALSTVYNQKE